MMHKLSKKIILGSGSPRRRELLSGLDLEFTLDTGNSFEESVPEGARPEDVPMLMALGKSHGFHRPLEDNELLITADTVVIIDGCVIGKPHGREDAAAMLRRLSGRTHTVVSAVCFRDACGEWSLKDSTEVSFAPLSEEEINYYIDKYKPYDKAGAYGIQEWIGYVAIRGVKGSFYTVMGFPVDLVWAELKKYSL
ncbi:MAG: septum formation protein Maf [Bacteroidales bacterium]|nr:septum formation protein Maf [Bacteroidales bacterium]